MTFALVPITLVSSVKFNQHNIRQLEFKCPCPHTRAFAFVHATKGARFVNTINLINDAAQKKSVSSRSLWYILIRCINTMNIILRNFGGTHTQADPRSYLNSTKLRAAAATNTKRLIFNNVRQETMKVTLMCAGR